MAAAIGASMRAVGVHQGLAPVLDVTSDLRWGRVEETIGAGPLPGRDRSAPPTCAACSPPGIGDAQALRRVLGVPRRAEHGTGGIGPREFADVFLVPFEMALRLGGARLGHAVLHRRRRHSGVKLTARC